MTETQPIDPLQIAEIFRSELSAKSDNTARSYNKAIACFESFIGTYAYADRFPDESVIADWFVNMRTQGLTAKTALHYLDIVAALYNETAGSTGSFGALKRRAKALTNNPVDFGFDRLLGVVRRAAGRPDGTSRTADILLYSLLNRAMPPAEVVRVRTADIDSDMTEVAEIVRRNASARRKYLFDLGQSRYTARQLTTLVDSAIARLLAAHNIPVVSSIDDTIRAHWAHMALKCGIPGTDVVALLGTPPAGLPELALCSPGDIDDICANALTATVAAAIVNNPPQWYAMRLRPRVDYEDMTRRVEILGDTVAQPEFFYPYEEITRRIGRKLVHDKQPVIKDIVFFRLRHTDILPLFSNIGDIAWCYTHTGKPGSDYAAISKESFYNFQKTIDHFTPDYDITPIGGFEPSEGETVVVLNGLLADVAFDIDKIEQRENTIIRLHMTGSNGIQWRTTATPRQLTPSL